jgi:hypothetical protein
MTSAEHREPTLCQTEATLRAEGCLIEANINPRTGLATDYLNHFNEAIMLLEMFAELPECRDDFLAWHPKKYDEHFAASNSKHRDITIAAYAEADPELRQRLDTLADCMNEILAATREVMRKGLSESAATTVADIAVRWVKPLVARAGAVINGTEAENGAAGRNVAPQTAVDALMAR